MTGCEKGGYHRWRDKLWRSSAHRGVCWTGRCSSLHPGWWPAGWWADCRTGRRSATLSPGMEALSWGHCALQRRRPLWLLLVQRCVSILSAPPFQAIHRSTRERPSCHSLLFCCLQRKYALGINRLRRKDKKGTGKQRGEKLDNSIIPKYEDPKQKRLESGAAGSAYKNEPPLTAPKLFINMTGWASTGSSTCVQGFREVRHSELKLTVFT